MSTGLDPFEADVLVDQFEWSKTSAPRIIGTIGLGPCMGIALYNTRTKEGYVGHFVAPLVDAVNVENMMHEALSGSSPTELRAWVRGGSADPNIEGDVKHTKANRNYVRSLLERLGIESPDIKWLESADDVVDIVLDCKTGLFESFEDTFEDT